MRKQTARQEPRPPAQTESRKCPECGSDLSARGAIALARFGRRPGLAVAGALILLIPALLLTGLFTRATRVAMVGPAAIGALLDAGHPKLSPELRWLLGDELRGSGIRNIALRGLAVLVVVLVQVPAMWSPKLPKSSVSW